jgi:hypothetical protein
MLNSLKSERDLQTRLSEVCVVICPLALPDAGWPETLKLLPETSKSTLSAFLNQRIITTSWAKELNIVQSYAAGEQLLSSILNFDSTTKLGAFGYPLDCQLPYLAIRPVCLHAGSDHVVLKQGDASDLLSAELEQLAMAVEPLFAAEGLKLVRSPLERESRWFLTASGDPSAPDASGFFNLKSADSEQALGRNIDAYMAKGEFSRRWRRLETEIQMTWFDHSVNLNLAAQGKNPINSIWLEGAVHQTPSKPNDLQGLHSAKLPLNQLAQCWSIAHDNALADAFLLPGHLHVYEKWNDRLAGDAIGWLGAWNDFIITHMANPYLQNATVVFTGEKQFVTLNRKQQSNAVMRGLLANLKSIFGVKLLSPAQAELSRILGLNA